MYRPACLSFLVGCVLVISMSSALAETDRIEIVVSSDAFTIEESPEGHRILAEGFGRLAGPGGLDLPGRVVTVAVPVGARDIRVLFRAEGKELPGRYRIAPRPLPRVTGATDPAAEAARLAEWEAGYRKILDQAGPYPAGPARLLREAGYRRYRLVDVQVAPFACSPRSGRLTRFPEVTVIVEFELAPEGAGSAPIRDGSPRTEATARALIANLDQARSWYPPIDAGRGLYDYVIITLPSLTGAVQPLVTHEQSRGHTVKVVTTADIDGAYTGYDLAEKIRNFLRDRYPSSAWGIEDVCLVGHYDDVPMRRCWQDKGYGKPETDYYYAELSLPDSQSWDLDGDHQWGEKTDPIDFYAEVNVGRIPWSDPATVSHICTKTRLFELNTNPAYKRNILLLGAFFWPNTDNARLMEYIVRGDLHPWMWSWSKYRMYEQGHSNFAMDEDLRHALVTAAWSSGCYAFVDWAGHGSPFASYIYYNTVEAFVDTTTSTMLNDEFPAVIFADACSNSDTDYDNIGQMMMKRGAVGFLGATKPAFGYPGWQKPSHGSSQSLDYYFTTSVTSGYHTLGASHQGALRKMYVDGLFYYDKYEMFEWGALFGNPDLVLDGHDPLTADAQELSAATGGQVTFFLDADADHGGRTYLLLGSITGSAPGFALPGGLTVPLNWDLFTNVVLTSLATPSFTDFMGVLDSEGRATALFDTLGPLIPDLAGETLTFAFFTGAPGWDFVSNPVKVAVK